MIIFRYLFTEALKAQAAVFLIMITIFSSNILVRVLDDAMDGQLPTNLLAWMLLLNIQPLVGLILPLSLFIGIFLAHGRMYADNEISVLKACGVSEWYVSRVTLVLALLMAILTGLNTIWWGPAAYEKRAEVRDMLKADIGLSTLIPGQFQHTSDKKGVIFVHDSDGIESGNLFSKVFVAQIPSMEDEKQTFNVVYAKTGEVSEGRHGEQSLNLKTGHRYEGEEGQLNYQITEFDSYYIKIKEQQIEERRRKLSAVSTKELLQRDDLEAIAEWQWRLALPLSVPLVALIAVPLARVQPRQGKFAKLVPAFFIYLVYFLLLMGAKSAIGSGKIPPSIGLWWIHTCVFIYGAYLFTNERTMGRKIKAKFKLRRRAL